MKEPRFTFGEVIVGKDDNNNIVIGGITKIMYCTDINGILGWIYFIDGGSTILKEKQIMGNLVAIDEYLKDEQ